jgi:hypothetical protein
MPYIWSMANFYKLAPYFVIAILLVIIVLMVDKCNKNKDDAANVTKMLDAARDSTKHFQNKLGQEVATKLAVEGRVSEIKEFLTAEITKDLKETFDVKLKDLKSYISVVSARDNLLKPNGDPIMDFTDEDTIPTDTPKPPVAIGTTQPRSVSQSFAGPWDSVDVRIGEGAYARVRSWDTTRIVIKDTAYGKLFNRQHATRINVQSANPNVRNTVTGAYLIKADSRKTFFELYGRTGYRYFKDDPAVSNLYGGVEGQFNFGRISVTGGYNKLLGGTDKYFIEGGAKFRIIRF